jgi:CRISPR-associated protein Cmr2
MTNAQTMLDELLETSGIANDPALPCHEQLAQQLASFPEVHWAAVPFALVERDANGKAAPEQAALATASRAYLGDSDKPGFLGNAGRLSRQADACRQGAGGRH